MSQSTRIKKFTGKFNSASSAKLLGQIQGKAILAVVSINTNCVECEKTQLFIQKMEAGLIHKMPDLILLYGYNSKPLQADGEEISEAEANPEPEVNAEGEEVPKKKENTPRDTQALDWEDHTSGHGYSIYTSEDNFMIETGEFDHGEFRTVLLDYLRRFRSSVLTLADLEARRKFLENKKSGIIIETRSSTKTSEIIKLEEYVQARKNTVRIPIYFLKGMTEEISYVVQGEYMLKQKGLNLQKFIKGVAKLAQKQ